MSRRRVVRVDCGPDPQGIKTNAPLELLDVAAVPGYKKVPRLRHHRRMLLWTVSMLACGEAGRTLDQGSADAGNEVTRDAGSERDAGPESGEGAQSYVMPGFCVRGARDAVALLFCKQQPPGIDGVASLRKALSLVYAQMLAHSTGLNGVLVSTINPRVILVNGARLGTNSRYVAMAFVRGAQSAEFMAYDPQTGRLNLYLLEFRQACNAAEGGCRPGDLFAPAIEEEWLELRLRDDEELKNTPSDCRRCHGGAPDEPGPMVLMRELRPPWTHWFTDSSVLRKDYLAAKRDPARPGTEATEAYAGTTLINVVGPSGLEHTVEQAEVDGQQPAQPLLFAGAEIGFETGDRDRSGLPVSEPREYMRSPTWQALYDAFLGGLAPAPPDQYERVPDAQKLQMLAGKYQAFLAGTLDQEELPDLADIFPDDPQRRAEIGLETEPGAQGDALLLQACAPCHNQTLDQSVSRARFDVDLKRSGSAGIERAVERLELEADDALRMPPAGARLLKEEARSTLIDYLRRQRTP